MLAGLLVTLMAPAAIAQDPATVLQEMHQRQQARWAEVRNFTIVQGMAGDRMSRVPMYHERITVDGEIAFRLVPEAEWSSATTGLSREQTVAVAEGMATGLELMREGPIHEGGGRMDPYTRNLTGDMIVFLRAVKNYDENETREGAESSARMAAAFRRRARVTGRETIGDRSAHVVRAEGLEDVPIEQEAGGPRFTLKTVTLWVDVAEAVPLRLVMEGRMEGSEAPVLIEMREEGYRHFGALYEPTTRVMRLTGMMEAMATDPRKKRELQRAREEAIKAQAQMKEMEERLEAMPAAQRRMIEGQMNRARQQMDMIINQGVFEVTIQREVIGINEGPPIGWRPLN